MMNKIKIYRLTHLIDVAFPLTCALCINPKISVQLVWTKSFVFNFGSCHTFTQRDLE